MKRAYYKTRPGVSLLISLLLVGVLVLFGLIVSNLVISSIRDSANINRTNQSFYAAEGALEEGLLANQSKGPGYSDVNPVSVSFLENCGIGAVCNPLLTDLSAQYQIQGQTPFTYDADDRFGVPMPGTGDAGSGCDTAHPFVSGSFYYSASAEPHYVTSNNGLAGYIGPYVAKDHPCNWGKIHVGETVSIPLYVTVPGQNGNVTVLNPADPDFDLKSLKIMVRTPCSNGDEFCDPQGRSDLDTSDGDDTIILWQIFGTSLDGKKSYELGARTDKDAQNNRKIPLNSEIFEGRINQARINQPYLYCNSPRYCSINQQNSAKDQDGQLGTVLNFIRNQAPSFSRLGNEVINKPVLKLTVIHDLKNSVGPAIPYLEYQILLDTNKNIAPADINQNIAAEATVGSFRQILGVKQPQESGLLEYVIQQ